MEVIYTEHFFHRLEEFTDYIALDDIPTAIKWSEDLLEMCGQLALHPESGRIIPEFSSMNVREILVGNYRVVYEIKESRVNVLTIWHARQTMKRDF